METVTTGSVPSFAGTVVLPGNMLWSSVRNDHLTIYAWVAS